jgi:hypothetical protein
MTVIAVQKKPIFDIKTSAIFKSMQLGGQKTWARQADANKLGHAHMIDFFVENALPLSVRRGLVALSPLWVLDIAGCFAFLNDISGLVDQVYESPAFRRMISFFQPYMLEDSFYGRDWFAERVKEVRLIRDRQLEATLAGNTPISLVSALRLERVP